MFKSRILGVLILFLSWLATTAFLPLNAAPSLPAALSPAAVPADFGKASPLNGTTGLPTTGVVLHWNPSSAGVTYQYCLRTSPSCPGPKWVTTGTVTQAPLTSLTPGVTYYWQVRAVDNATQAITYADSGAWWWFSVLSNANLPGAFDKIGPVDASTGVVNSGLALSWGTSTGATSYEYCFDTNNNNACDKPNWTSTGSGTTASLPSLEYDTLYYWQVQAVNSYGSTEADYGTWWSFRTRVAPPGDFAKLAPTNGALGQPLSLTLSWQASSRATSYEYCYDTAHGTACAAKPVWDSTAATSAPITGLSYETTYYWQVRAVNITASTPANGGVYWSFSTTFAAPAAFSKTGPENADLHDQPLNPTLSWETSAGTNVTYEYCFSITTTADGACNGAWSQPSPSTSAALSGLAYNTLYYWQVRASNTTGTTYANGSAGALWHFSTRISPPELFDKVGPADTAGSVPTNVRLQWSPSAGAASYFYCVYKSGGTPCDPLAWVDNGSNTMAVLDLLDLNTTYYWQVYAKNGQGETLANGGTWWSFTTIASVPSGFSKISPADAAPNQPLSTWLYWSPKAGALTYQYCLSASADCPEADWHDAPGTDPFVDLTGELANETTYYWQVRAVTGTGTVYADDAVRSFSTLKAPPTVADQSFETDEDKPLSAALAATSNYGKTFILYGAMPAGDLVFNSNGSFTYDPAPNFNGQVSFQFVVADGYNPPTPPHTATITVKPVNDAPQLQTIANKRVKTGSLVTFIALASDADLPYGDVLTLSILGTLPAGANFDPATGLFSWIPTWSPLTSNVYTVTVVVTDADLPIHNTAQQDVVITVDPLVVMIPVILK